MSSVVHSVGPRAHIRPAPFARSAAGGHDAAAVATHPMLRTHAAAGTTCPITD
jgi:hypothetical protein